jgi:rhodanese-related sulfurtransferase
MKLTERKNRRNHRNHGFPRNILKTIAAVTMIAGVGLSPAGLAPAAAQTQAQTQAPAQRQEPAFKANKLTRAEFDALLQDPAKVLIIDVRRPDELESIGGFPAFLSIQAAQIEKHLAFIPKDRLIVTVSNHANRAGRAADLLDQRGFKVAGAIGAQDYEAEGGTLVKVTKPEGRRATAAH